MERPPLIYPRSITIPEPIRIQAPNRRAEPIRGPESIRIWAPNRIASKQAPMSYCDLVVLNYDKKGMVI